MGDPILFPWFICVPIHAKEPLAWIRGLNDLGLMKNTKFCFVKFQIFDVFFTYTNGEKMFHSSLIFRYTQQFTMGMVNRVNDFL